MFTGIVEELGEVRSMTPNHDGGASLRLRVPGFASELAIGESLAVNGCCLTVTTSEETDELVRFDLLQQTLDVTNLGRLQPGNLVNLERAMLPSTRMSGHFVQGHVDTISTLLAIDPVGQDTRLEFEIPTGMEVRLISRGSITVDGISLTVADLGETSFSVWITPHTRKVTNIQGMKAGDLVNLEFDMIGKYVARFMEFRGAGE